MRSGLAAAACLAAIGCAGGEPGAHQSPTHAEAAVEATTSPRSCASLELTPLRVVRIDDRQRRLFAAAGAPGAQLEARVHDLETCFGFTEWAGRWSLSVFTDPTLARYKDDPQVTEAVKDGRWARAYVAEYDSASRKMTRDPAGR